MDFKLINSFSRLTNRQQPTGTLSRTHHKVGLHWYQEPSLWHTSAVCRANAETPAKSPGTAQKRQGPNNKPTQSQQRRQSASAERDSVQSNHKRSQQGKSKSSNYSSRSKTAHASTDLQHAKHPSNAPEPIAVEPGQCWRLFQVTVPYATDPGKDDISVHDPLKAAVIKRLGCRPSLPASAISLVRKSFDSRPAIKGVRSEKRWVYVVDVDAAALQAAGGSALKPAQGQLELIASNGPNIPPTLPHESSHQQLVNQADSQNQDMGAAAGGANGSGLAVQVVKTQHPVIVVGSGPAGLFAALAAAQAGLPVLVLERGQPVEQRGKDIGALLVRGLLNPDSNLCYGEGGAGTWSDGKLATKIGRNSDPVRAVLQALVDFGAPESILVSGKPHLGTDRLVLILKQLRHHLLHQLGAQVRFGTSVEDVEVSHGRVTGVKLKGTGEVIKASAVVLAVGHSARGIYRRLRARDVALTPKPFAMGFRVEHPQTLIDRGRYGEQHAADVQRGKGRIPVADYKLNVEVKDDAYQETTLDNSCNNSINNSPLAVEDGSQQYNSHHSSIIRSDIETASSQTDVAGNAASEDAGNGKELQRQKRSAVSGGGGVEEYGGNTGRPVPPGLRGVYSFCMCPGGQIVCTSTNPEELCLNGMSFSRRNSQWANSALVVNVGPSDWSHHQQEHGVLAGVAYQEEMEREAARRGGGALVAPVQRVVDFVEERVSTGQLPSSSYRLGVKSAPLHDLYPPFVYAALCKALERFERTIPGFASSPDALLHGIEARTSAPIRVDRDPVTLESISLQGLYPSGEGAGYAGGIVSAAVDGMKVGQAVAAAFAKQLVL